MHRFSKRCLISTFCGASDCLIDSYVATFLVEKKVDYAAKLCSQNHQILNGRLSIFIGNNTYACYFIKVKFLSSIFIKTLYVTGFGKTCQLCTKIII